MSKAKIASKNNPEGRGQAKEYFHNNRQIRPVKLITGKVSFLSAEYEDNGELVLGVNSQPMSWTNAREISTFKVGKA